MNGWRISNSHSLTHKHAQEAQEQAYYKEGKGIDVAHLIFLYCASSYTDVLGGGRSLAMVESPVFGGLLEESRRKKNQCPVPRCPWRCSLPSFHKHESGSVMYAKNWPKKSLFTSKLKYFLGKISCDKMLVTYATQFALFAELKSLFMRC